MKEPFCCLLPEGVKSRKTIRKTRTKFDQGRIQYAKIILHRSSMVNSIIQYYSGFSFYLSQVNLIVKKPVTLDIKIAEPNLLFTFLIKGDIHLPSIQGANSFSLHAGNCCIIPIQPGESKLTLFPGQKKIVFFTLSLDWLNEMSAVYPALVTAFQNLANTDIVSKLYKPLTMTWSNARHLKKLRDCKSTNKVELEASLMSGLNKLANECQSQLLAPKTFIYKSDRQIALEVRDRIIETVEGGSIPSIQRISEQFNVEPKALRRHCYKIFHMNIQDLIEDAQMKIGHSLIQKGIKIKTVSERLGFAETAVFSRKYKRYFGYCPSKILLIENESALKVD